MKIEIKKVLALFIAIIITFITMFSCGKIVNAEVPSTQVVTGYTGIWNDYTFNYQDSGKYYIIQDSTGIPNGTYLNPYYFYTLDGQTFDAIRGIKVFATVLNKVIGLIVDPNMLDNVFENYLTAINVTDYVNNKYCQNCLYDSNDNFLGYCLNDISGCYYGPNLSEQVAIPSNYPNNIYNYLEYEKDIDIDVSDYFTFISPSISEWLADCTYSNSNVKTWLTNQSENYNLIYFAQKQLSGGNYYYMTKTSTNQNSYYGLNGDFYCIQNPNALTEWTNFCTSYGIKSNVHELYYNNMDLKSVQTKLLNAEIYDASSNSLVLYVDLVNGANSTISQKSVTSSQNLSIGTQDSNNLNLIAGQNVTFYKDQATYDAINVDKDYVPEEFYTNDYNQYNSNNDNSFNTTKQIIDNSVYYNEQIYQDSNDNYYNYVDNGYVDQSQIVNNTSTITNNYYSGSLDPDDPDNPDNPDDPDNPDSPVLEEILAAILRFFNAIGDIIGTILAGLVNMIAAVLESIATLTGQITNLSDFFSSLLGWLPEPIPQVIGIGISLVIIAGVIKFIRG